MLIYKYILKNVEQMSAMNLLSQQFGIACINLEHSLSISTQKNDCIHTQVKYLLAVNHFTGFK